MSKYDKLPRNTDKVWLIYHKRLLMTKDCFNQELLTADGRATEEFHKKYRQQEAIVKDSAAQNFLRGKRKIYRDQLEQRLGEQASQHHSFFQLFINWSCDLLDLYKLNKPEDTDIKIIELLLLSRLAAWELDSTGEGVREGLNNVLKLVFLKLKEVSPEAEEFIAMWNAFSTLLFDTVPGVPWNANILVMELEEYLSKSYLKSGGIILRPDRVFKREFPLNEWMEKWKGECFAARKNWDRVVPITMELCSRGTSKTITDAQNTLTIKDAASIISVISNWYLGIEEFFKEHADIAHFLQDLENCPIEEFQSHQQKILQIRGYIVNFSKEKHFPNSMCLSEAEETAYFQRFGFDEPGKVAKIIISHRMLVRTCHQLLNTFTCMSLHQVSHLYVASLSMSKVMSSRKTHLPLQVSVAVSSDAKENKIAPVKRKSEKVVRKPLVERINNSNPKQQPKVERKVEPRTSEDKTETVAAVSFRTLLKAGSSQTQKQIAAHADLYKLNVKASQSLHTRFSHFPEHALNILRLGVLNVGTMYETALHFKACLIEPDFKIEGHNLWPLFRQVGIPSIEKSIAMLYQSSNWVRYTHEIYTRMRSMLTRVHKLPPALKALKEVSDGTQVQLPLASLLNDAISHHDEIAKAMECKAVRVISVNPTIEADIGLSCDVLAQLQEKIAGLNGKNTWVCQLNDDLDCLESTLKLFQSDLSIDEYVLLTGHFQLLLHAVVQSTLYALRMKKGLQSTTEHDLVKLWNETGGPISENGATIVKKWLNNANGMSRYPYSYQDIQSELHRIHLGAIAMQHRPEILDGFTVEGPDQESSIVESLGWSPNVKNIAMPQEQKKLLQQAATEICQLIIDELISKF